MYVHKLSHIFCFLVELLFEYLCFGIELKPIKILYDNREADRCYSGDIFMVHETGDDIGIENTNRSRDNVYEYRDKPIRPQTLSLPSRPSSQASTGSGISLREGHYVSSSPNPNGRSTPPPKAKVRQNIKTQLVQGVPQTQV